jgi:hypothetical protein
MDDVKEYEIFFYTLILHFISCIRKYYRNFGPLLSI